MLRVDGALPNVHGDVDAAVPCALEAGPALHDHIPENQERHFQDFPNRPEFQKQSLGRRSHPLPIVLCLADPAKKAEGAVQRALLQDNPYPGEHLRAGYERVAGPHTLFVPVRANGIPAVLQTVLRDNTDLLDQELKRRPEWR